MQIASKSAIAVFATLKRADLTRFNAHVTQWEHKEYIELC